MRARHLFFLPLLALLAGACADHPQDPLQPGGLSSMQMAAVPLDLDSVPPRTGYWEEMSDKELWEHLAEQDGHAVLGVKNPGEPRGIWRATVLTQPATMRGAEAVAAALQGVDVLQVEDWAPAMRLRIESLSALSAIRSQPFVDYLQPLYIPSAGDDAWMSGCGWGEPFTGSAPTTSRGDLIPPGLARMDIQNAWRRNAGEAAVIGLTDTGVSLDQADLLGNFATGGSTGRWHEILTVISGGTDDQCGHGTRLSGLAFAPNNSSSIVGAAWKANGVSVRQGDGVNTSFGINSGNAASAINVAFEVRRNAGFPNRRIISMAWGSRKTHDLVEDAVRSVHAMGALLLGASGTEVGDWTGVVFPATMSEVIAVSAVNSSGGRVAGIGYGNAVELAGYVDMLATGQYTGQTRTLGGSSAAVTAVAGIAALTWTQFPHSSNAQIRQRLRSAGGNVTRNTTTGYGIVNAARAVGGLYSVPVDAPFWVDPFQTFTVTANPQGGTGSFSYQWSNGATTRSTTYTAGPEGTSVNYSVTVTDNADGIVQSGGGVAYVQDRSGCVDPTQIDC